MQYMLLIYDAESDWGERDEAERGALMQEYFAYTDELQEAGKLVSSAPLEPSRTGQSVRVRDGEVSVTDGPFAETKEQLGGYYVVDVDTPEEAAEWAAKIPSARFGTIEVRAIMQIPAEARS